MIEVIDGNFSPFKLLLNIHKIISLIIKWNTHFFRYLLVDFGLAQHYTALNLKKTNFDQKSQQPVIQSIKRKKPDEVNL